MLLKSGIRETIHAIVLILAVCSASFAQENIPPAKALGDSGDSTAVLSDTSKVDSTIQKKPVFESEVDYNADDSMRFSLVDKKAFLYGNAFVSYESISLTAAFIEIDFDKSEVRAYGRTDSTGKSVDKPVFTDKGTEYSMDTITYNFETKKGLINRVVMAEGQGFIHAEVAKRTADESLYIRNGKYTTCNHPEPHFYINASKLKVTNNKKIVTGPAYLAIEDVPTPLAIPFGFFPNSKENTSGILIPRYGNSPSLGYYLQDGGYYLRLSDYWDIAARGDIYTRGSWAANMASNYRRRYSYNGNFNFRYTRFVESEREFPDFSRTENYFVQWRHTQDPKARPNTRFSANVNAGSVSNFRNDINTSVNDYLTNTFQSSINYGKSWAGKPYNLTISATHSQNTSDSIVNITFPNATFAVSRIFPFKSKTVTGKEQWYEKIGVSYNTNLKNQVSEKEDNLFTQRTLQRMRNGMEHTIPISTSFKVLKHFTLAPSMTFGETWYLERYEQTWNQDSSRIDIDTVPGFSRYGTAQFAAQLSTRLYGMYTFKKTSKVQAIRHVMTPTLNYSFQPDYASPFFGYIREIQTDTLGSIGTYSEYDNGIFSGPTANQNGVLRFNLINNLEMKVRTNSDSSDATKKIKIFESLNLSSSYFLARDSLKLSVINISGRTVLFEKINVQLSGVVDPYDINSNGRRVDKFTWDTSRELGRLTSARATVGFRFKSPNAKPSAGADQNNNQPRTRASDLINPEDPEYQNILNNPDAYVDFNVPWSINVNYNITYSKPTFEPTIRNSLTFNGDVNLTPKWKLGFRSGYDFESNDFTFSSFDIYRDLHCWEFRFNIIPFGNRQSYTFDINVKASVLQDLKLSRRRNWYDLVN